MVTISLVQAKAHLNKLLDRVKAGVELVITRHGRPVARISPAMRPKRPLDTAALSMFRATMPRLRHPSAALVREARDQER